MHGAVTKGTNPNVTLFVGFLRHSQPTIMAFATPSAR